MKSQHQKILNLLSDGAWHCGQEINDLYIKDDRKRLSELRQMGYAIETAPCNLKDHIHNSKIVMRRLVAKIQQAVVIEVKSKEEVSKAVNEFLKDHPSIDRKVKQIAL